MTSDDNDLTRRPVPGSGDSDRAELRTVGVDIGSATFHFVLSRVGLERRAQELSSRFDVVSREVLWSSPICLTPYVDSDDAIDVSAVDDAVRRGYLEAGITPAEIDSGAVLLTGTAAARHNARSLAERIAGRSGRFVCAAAGHHLEAVLAANGSGAVEQSIVEATPVVNVDIGGATTKLALAIDGEVRTTAALAVGGRLVAWDASGVVTRVERSVMPLVQCLGIDLRPGTVIRPPVVGELCEYLARAVVDQLALKSSRSEPDLLLTAPFCVPAGSFAVMLSCGVSEYLRGQGSEPGHGDLGPDLALAVLARLLTSRLGECLRPARHRIRATVIGASQFSTQVTGSTIHNGQAALLPIHNVPVVRPQLPIGASVDAGAVARAVRWSIDQRSDELFGGRALALAIAWEGVPDYRRLRALADGVHAAIRGLVSPPKLVILAVDRDLGASIGRIMIEEVGVETVSLVCLDNLDVGDLDYLDIGRPSLPANVVPVVVKSLLFDAGGNPADDVADPLSTFRPLAHHDPTGACS